MALLVDFADEFPARCSEVLSAGIGAMRGRGREVTFLLMVASSGFLMPFERLRPPETSGSAEHFLDDRGAHPEAADRLDELLGSPFLESTLASGFFGEWSLAKVKPENLGGLQSRTGAAFRPISKDKQVVSVLKILRNALAHGNVLTRGEQAIERIVFISELRSRSQDAAMAGRGVLQHYECLSTSPAALESFLREWLSFLERSSVSQRLAFQRLQEAA